MEPRRYRTRLPRARQVGDAVNIEIKRSDLLHALAAADGIARPGVMPLLECVLITAVGRDAVTVAATDTQMTIRAELASTNRKEGSLAINAKILRDVTKGAPADTIQIAALDNAWVEIKSGKARYRLAALPGRDFPKVPEPGEGTRATFNSDALKSLIDRVLFSVSEDKTRPQINGALFEVRAGVASMTSTDGHRLTRATRSCEATEFSANVPREALAKLAKIATDEVKIIVERSRIFATTGGVTLMSPIITEPPFPPIAAIVDSKRPNAITVNRAALIASIERTRITTTDTRGMSIDTRDGMLVLSSSDPDRGDVSDEIEIDGKAKISTCVAPKYLIDPLARMSDEDVAIRFGGELDPVAIESATEPNSYTALVMPMRR